jgi:hypothetical protein
MDEPQSPLHTGPRTSKRLEAKQLSSLRPTQEGHDSTCCNYEVRKVLDSRTVPDIEVTEYLID